LLSDRNLDEAALDEAAIRIKSGKPPRFDEAAIDAMAKEIDELPKQSFSIPVGCRIATVVLLAVPLILLALIVFLFIYVRSNQP